MTERTAAAATTSPVAVSRSFDGFQTEQRRSTAAVVAALRGGPQEEVDDVVQEAFARAQARWDRVGVMDRPDQWVHRVALNLTTSRWRRATTGVRTRLRLAGRRDDAAHATDAVDAADVFWSAVRRLSPRQAQVVAPRYAADLPLADVAAPTGLAVGTVKSTLHAAHARLATLLDTEEYR